MRFLSMLLLVVVPEVAYGKDLHVNGATGNDATTHAANSAAAPWRTVGRAAWGSASRETPNPAQAAQAGDTVIVAAGVYTVTGNGAEREIPALNPANSGTAGSPIVFKTAPGARVELRSTVYGGPVIGTHDRSYIVWDGFYVDEQYVNTVPDTGPVVTFASDHIVFRNLELRGKSATWSDNHNAIRVEESSYVTLQNNLMYGFRMVQGGRNGSAVMTYHATHLVVENNTVHSSDGGIFIKGANYGPVTIRRNLVHGIASDAICFGGIGVAEGSAGAIATQNVVRNSDAGITFLGYDAYSPRNVTVANNTLHNNLFGIFLKPSSAGYLNLRIHNNIVSASSVAMQGEDISDVSNTDFEHNVYSGASTLARLAGTNYTLAQWQSSFTQDAAAPASRVVDPQFVNAGANDFHLQAGSPARTGGVDLLDLNGNGSTTDGIAVGAYLTGNETIGAVSGGLPPVVPTPTAPAGLRVVR